MSEPRYLIFGATGGIGSALTERLAKRGCGLLLAARGEQRLRELASRTGAERIVADARDPGATKQAVEAAAERLGGLDGAVNLAGSILLKPAHPTRSEDWNDAIATNLTTAFHLVRSAAPVLRKHGGGSIVLMSSCAATVGLANHEAISAAKAGVEGLARSAAATYAGAGVWINCVAPGLVRTPLSERMLQTESGRRTSEAMHPLGRVGEPEDVASAIAWLLDPGNDWITGQVVGVDGGLARLRPRTDT